MNQKIPKSLFWNFPTQITSSQLASRPSTVQAKENSSKDLSQSEKEREAFSEDRHEASRLQLKAETGTLTSGEEERLEVLQAKMNNFWVQRREKASRFGHNLANIPVSSPQQQDSTVQAKLTIGEPGDKYEREADSVAANVVNRIDSPQFQQQSQEVQPHLVEGENDFLRGNLEKSIQQVKKEPQLTTVSTKMIQMVREDEFKANPKEFMEKNVVSLTMQEGLLPRLNDPEIEKYSGKFINKMGSFSKHWFKLVPDSNRTKEDRNAYILTPAIEKYIQEYPEDELLAQISGKKGIPDIEADEHYIQSAFVEYKHGQSKETNIGHTTVTKDRNAEEDFNPDFVFTPAMNGCAFVVTPAENDGHFEAWHYQSPEAQDNFEYASQFRKDKQPMDWYGPEEYDDGDHRGLFEVTNLLHRDKNNIWKLLSQQNETSAYNPNDIEIKQVEERLLNLEGGNEFRITKKIYQSIIESKEAEIEAELDKVNKRLNLFEPEAKESVVKMKTTIFFLLKQEIENFNKAETLQDLNAAGKTIKNNRLENQLNVEQMISSLRQHFLIKYDLEKKKLWKSQDKIHAYNSSASNLERVGQLFNKFDWIEGLIRETTEQTTVPSTSHN